LPLNVATPFASTVTPLHIVSQLCMVVLFKIRLPPPCTVICPPAFTYTMQLFSVSAPFTKNVPATKMDFPAMVSVPANVVESAKVVSVFAHGLTTSTHTLSCQVVLAGEVMVATL